MYHPHRRNNHRHHHRHLDHHAHHHPHHRDPHRQFAEIKEEAHAAYETARSLGLMGDMPGQGLDDLDDLEEEADREPPVATRHLLSMALRFTASFLALLLAFMGGWFGQLMYNYDLETNKVPKLAWALLFMIPLSVVGSLHLRAMFSNAASDCEAAGLAAAWIFCMAAYLSLGFMGFAGSAPNVSTDSLSGYHMSVTLPCAVSCCWRPHDALRQPTRTVPRIGLALGARPH